MWSQFFPIMRWARDYRASWLVTDLMAGVTLGAVMVPVGLAFGELAGMPMAGLYAGIAPLLLYAVFGSSRQLIVGPDATMATVVTVSLAPLANGDPVRLAALVALLGISIGVVLIIGGILRLGFVADFLAKPVIVGFMHGLAAVILIGQLPKVLGIAGGGDTTLAQLAHVAQNIGQTNRSTLIVGVSSVVVILLVRRWVPRVPGQVLVLLGSLAAVHMFNLTALGVAVVGDIPRGLPGLHVPTVSLEDIRTVASVALAAALLAFSDSIVTARGFASRNRYRIDANQELIALGVSSIASAVTQGLPISGSGSRTAVAESTGSHTQLTSVAAAVTVATVILFLTPYLSALPSATLGGILIAAAFSLCDVEEFRRLWQFRGVSLFTAVIVGIGVVAVGVMEGILLGVVASLVFLLKAVTFPHDAVLGRTSNGFRDRAHYQDAQPVPGMIVYRFSGPLIFANCSQFRSRIESLVQEAAEPPQLVVLDASAIFEVDLTACETLIDVAEWLRGQRIRFAIVRLRARVKVTLARGGFAAHLGDETCFSTVESAMDNLMTRS